MVGGTNIHRIWSLRSYNLAALRKTENVAADDQKNSHQQDSELVRLAATGDADALATLYDRYAPRLYRVLLAILQSQEDAEDALQEVFLRLSTGRMKQARDVGSYLHMTARNIALDILRRRKRETQWDESDIAEMLPEQRSDVVGMLRFLPTEQREVIALKVFEEMTFAQIAGVVKTSPNTAASRYRYGIEKLRQWMREGECDE